ncbi:50S ribosomal protein L32 [Candidatus Peregrinibacteria bacterium]|nr:50S ribosomal protein L32 [Candidatus Peregrinibacteria bacterium]
MAKHPVPKKKVSNARTAKRYAAFANKKYKKIKAFVNVVKCKSCGNPSLNQQACPSCGNYRGRSVINMGKAVEKITKVKA